MAVDSPGIGKQRVCHHPILGELPVGRVISFSFDGQVVDAIDGEPILAALVAHGFRRCRTTRHNSEARWFFCGIGRCTDCMMIVDGIPNVRTCVTPVRNGMIVETQEGAGRWSADVDSA